MKVMRLHKIWVEKISLLLLNKYAMRRSRNFHQEGGGGCPGQSDKKALTFFVVFYTSFFFVSPKLILQKSNGQFQRNLSFFKVPERVQHFPGGGGGFNFFQVGSNCLFRIETHITCDFTGGSGPPCPPLWIRICMLSMTPSRLATLLSSLIARPWVRLQPL